MRTTNMKIKGRKPNNRMELKRKLNITKQKIREKLTKPLVEMFNRLEPFIFIKNYRNKGIGTVVTM